jgi:thiol:disulfide interchange protein DsbD
MSPNWHTYWKNPGESGLATTIRWTLPEGWTAGDIAWPLPEKKIENGDVLTYGYAGETMLMVSMTPPSTVVPGSRVTIKAQVDWLECDKTCIPGSANVELSLPVALEPPAGDHQKLFTRYRSQIPRPFDRTIGFSVEHVVRDSVLEVRLLPEKEGTGWPIGDKSVDFYPEPLEGYTLGKPSVHAAENAITIDVPITSLQKAADSRVFRGVVVLEDKNGERSGVLLEIPLPWSLLDQAFETGGSSGGEQPLVLYLFFAVIGGLILNIMPCVLPVIALKIFGLVKMAGDHSDQVNRLGWFFSLGILASFLLLALIVIVLKAAGQQVGWGFQFQEPLFVIAMGAIVFAFGLSLFGVYEIRPPSAVVSGVSNVLGTQVAQGKGYMASFWEGVFATILATPCTAPFLGSALGFAFSQPSWIVLLIFAAVGTGMALPYLILTARPAWMRYLPKPGVWMETAKQFMGFLMMATLLWLLYILGKQLGMEAVIWTGAFLLTVGIACWCVGRFATLTASRRRYYATWVVALLIVVGGYLGFLEGVLNVRGLIAGTPAAERDAETRVASGIAWEPFSLHSLESRLREHKPVFLDFTAEWCLTCKVNERTVLADQDVVQKLRSSGIVAIRADWTNRNPEITELLQKFGRSGVPLYVVFPAGKPTQPIVLPEVVTPGMVLEALDKAVAAR